MMVELPFQAENLCYKVRRLFPFLKLEDIQAGKSEFHAIEIMSCPGGCIGGGGQPYHHGDAGILKKRQAALYTEDKNKTLRKSHENPHIIELYEKFLGEPMSEKAHHLLHTEYFDRT